MRILAIDPGSTHSGWVLIDSDRRPLSFGKTENKLLSTMILQCWDELVADKVAIEMIASYGMAVGAEVFETCVWIGRFQQRMDDWMGQDVELIKRNPIKVHHCKSSKAKDSNIRQALVDRFASGQKNHGKGTKAEPGWFHGFHSDIWAAYALAVYAADIEEGVIP